MWWDFRSDLLFCYHVVCANFWSVLDVQIDESTTAGNAATRLTVAWIEAAFCTSLLLWSVSTEWGYGRVTGVSSLHSWFETRKLNLSLNHPISNFFYWWCQFSQELCPLIKGQSVGATALNVERTFITYFENNLLFYLLFKWLLLQKLHIWQEKNNWSLGDLLCGSTFHLAKPSYKYALQIVFIMVLFCFFVCFAKNTHT